MNKQNFIALDLELNQPSNKIIQVGVAIGNACQHPNEYIVKKWYIDPKEPIDPFIVDLTGITDSNIRAYSYSHATVARELDELIKKHKPWLNAVVWGYDDAGVLRKEFERNSVEFKHLGGRWIDLKTIYNFMMFSENANPRGGLTEAMAKYDLAFDGPAHRADVDAVNTLKFFFEVMNRQSTMIDIVAHYQYNKDIEDSSVSSLSKDSAASDILWEIDNG